jgi:hypothetical protein
MQREEITELRDDVARRRDKYDDARGKLHDIGDEATASESIMTERESTTLDLRSQTDRLNVEPETIISTAFQ